MKIRELAQRMTLAPSHIRFTNVLARGSDPTAAAALPKMRFSFSDSDRAGTGLQHWECVQNHRPFMRAAPPWADEEGFPCNVCYISHTRVMQ